MYRYVPLPGKPIPVGVQPFLVDESIPEDKEIACYVRRICLNRLGGPLGNRAEYLLYWLIDTTWQYTPDATNWHKVLVITQAVFRYGTLVKESM